MYMSQDIVCIPDTQKEYAKKIKYSAGEITLDHDHTYPAHANDAEFMQQLRSLLTKSGRQMTKKVCEGDFKWR